MSSNQVQAQVDIGAVGLRGLSQFSHILAALSTDNVTPMALLQMENLGAFFHVNGSHAAKVPQYATRAFSHSLGRLSLAIGWRRGDSVSLLAESAGGQAVTLLSVCLTNLYPLQGVGDILAHLCCNLLPKTLPIASPTHLADVANLLAKKLNILGFGNVLAEQTMRVMSAYESMGIPAPSSLLEMPSAESMVSVLECLSHLREVGSVVRITGSPGILYLLGIVIFMFPLDTIVSVETVLVHEGPDRRIVVEICATEPVVVQVEKNIGQPPYLTLSIQPAESPVISAPPCQFLWKGWLARKLELELAAFGARCTQTILVACCNMLVHLAPKFQSSYASKWGGKYDNGILALLGSHPRERIDRTCETVLLAVPDSVQGDLQTAWDAFALVMKPELQRVTCLCARCQASHGWATSSKHERVTSSQKACPFYQVWDKIGAVLTAGLYCFLVNAHEPVAVPGILPMNKAAEVVLYMLHGSDCYSIGGENIVYSAISMFSGYSKLLGGSSGQCTILPRVLETFHVDPDGLFALELYDGVFIFEGRYVRLDLEGIIKSYITLKRPDECEHREDSPLSDQHRNRVILTGVDMPRGAGTKLSLAMTRANPTAQFLCCEAESKCLLLQGCCLDCGVQQAGKDFHILIMS